MKRDEGSINWLILLSIILLFFLIGGGISFYFQHTQEESFTIDPEVVIDLEKEYNLVYWDYPLFIGQEERYEDFLSKSIAEFNRKFPNIKINYRLLSFKDGEEELQAALKLGQPPDLYHDIFAQRLFSQKLQIPVNLLFEAEESTKYSSLAIAALSYKQNIWGLPQWLLSESWVVNNEVLSKANINLKEISEHGWSYKDFYSFSNRLKELNDKFTIIFNPYNGELVHQLLEANHEDLLMIEKDKDQEIIKINHEALLDIFKFLDTLRTMKVFPSKTHQMNKRFLPDLWQGEAALIAPVNMWLFNNLAVRDQVNKHINLNLLPAPSLKKEASIPMKVTSLLLFRQEEYQGDDHSKAVYEFAKFINQKKNLIISKRLRVLPAYLALQPLWEREVELEVNSRDKLINFALQGSIKSISNQQELELVLKEIINKEYTNFWLKNMKPKEVVDSIDSSFIDYTNKLNFNQQDK